MKPRLEKSTGGGIECSGLKGFRIEGSRVQGSRLTGIWVAGLIRDLGFRDEEIQGL